MDLSALDQLLAKAAGARVACVGDVMLDRFVYGEVSRISPEAPIPVLRHQRDETMLGGAGNVARNVAAMGGLATLVGVVGDDEPGHQTLGLIGAEPAIEGYLATEAGRQTTVKTRFVTAGQQLLRLDAEARAAPAAATAERLARETANACRDARAILLSDYGKGAVSDAVIAACHAAREAGAVLIVDTKARDLVRYGPADILKPNAAELARATDLPTETDEEVEAALARALQLSGAKSVLVTRAAKGISLAVRDGGTRHFQGTSREVFDVSGAGDTALAALGLALAGGVEIAEAIAFALLASGVVVGKVGTATATPPELVEAALTARMAPAEAKIATAARMADEVARWRARGLRVGFTNGCFDVLHRGHVAYLTQARGWCDRLIVGLNSDRSVRALKGEGRPVNDLDSRALVLAGLTPVDLVVPFDDDTPLRLIEAARPDILVKGADYTVEGVVGGDLVAGWGGEVRLASLVEGFSTTAAIARMKEGVK